MRYDQARQTVIHGAGSIEALRGELATLGTARIALVASPSAARSAGYAALRTALADLDVVHEFTEVRSHAPVSDSEELASKLLASPPDAIVAYGGGSVSDTAKAVAILLAEGFPLTKHCSTFTPPDKLQHAQLNAAKIPVVSVPTSLSGAEVTPGGGATDENHVKRVFWDDKVASRVLVYDPLSLEGVPRDVILTTGMNGLAHCAEALYSRTATPITDALALDGARRFSRSLRRLAGGDDSTATREELLLAAHLGGMVISNARVGLHHAVCHVLGASLGLSHGVANSVMLPYVLEFNLDATLAQQARLADALDGPEGDAHGDLSAAFAVRSVQEDCGVPSTLAAAGVAESDLDEVARLVMQDRGLFFNPKRVSEVSEIRALLGRAWSGTLGVAS